MIMLATSLTDSKRSMLGGGMVGVVCLFFLFGGRFVIEGVVHGMVRLDGGDKKSGSKSHDHEVQWMSTTAAKTAENSVQCTTVGA
jgi:hypothetical protein